MSDKTRNQSRKYTTKIGIIAYNLVTIIDDIISYYMVIEK